MPGQLQFFLLSRYYLLCFFHMIGGFTAPQVRVVNTVTSLPDPTETSATTQARPG
jgi:hypothetical protein